jgi:hypothetical protein
MAKYFVPRGDRVSAEQWHPDPKVGVGYDAHGVEYTVCDTGLQTSRGFVKMWPGDWLVTGPDGERRVYSDRSFRQNFEPAE